MKERIREINIGPAKRAIIAQANRYIAESGAAVTLREVYYMFIGDDAFPADWIDEEYNREKGLDLDTKNTIKNYKRLGEILNDGRLAGLVDWSAMEDRGREAAVPLEFESLRERVEMAIRNFRLPRWRDQDCYVEVWVEKQALEGMAAPICSEYHVTLSVNKGYSSSSAMYEAAQRIREAARDRRVVLLYLGDHDPSGEDMVRDVGARMLEFGAVDNAADLEVRKVLITWQQIRRYRPPPNPAKVTDSRAKAYIRKHGDRSWELEALRPAVRERLLRAALDELVDRDRMDAIIAREERGKRQLEKAMRGIK